MRRVMAALTLGLMLLAWIGPVPAVAGPPPDADYHDEGIVNALRPALMPLAVQWAKEKYGPEATVDLRFISIHRNGTIQVHIDVEAPGRTCVFALFFKWQDGWRLVSFDDHSGSASGC